MPTVTNEQGGKQSKLTVNYGLLPPAATHLKAQGLTFGDTKYDSDRSPEEDPNWHKIPASDHIDHALTHLHLYRNGDRSEPHLVNAGMRIDMALELLVKNDQHVSYYDHPEWNEVMGEELPLPSEARDAYYATISLDTETLEPAPTNSQPNPQPTTCCQPAVLPKHNYPLHACNLTTQELRDIISEEVYHCLKENGQTGCGLYMGKCDDYFLNQGNED